MGHFQWKFSNIDKQVANALAEECGLDPFLTLLACGRGYSDPFSLDEFFSRDIVELEPYVFPDMEAAVDRVGAAIEAGEKIVIYGDYDCDGVTATALLYLFLHRMQANVSYYIPSRQEGYGMNEAAVERLATKGTKLLITVDNGISAHAEIERANALGMDVVVTDHHLPKETLPNALAVVNPHREDSAMSFRDFAGVGVAFALAVAIAGTSPETMLRYYGDLVALGTVADVMPLLHENRSMVYWGLQKINQSPSTGVKALFAAAGARFGEITAGTLSFTAVPRINAAGRLGDASRAVEMLISDNYAAAMEIAAGLDDENKRRQQIEQEIAKAAARQVMEHKLYRNRVMVIAGEGWHEGVLGIAAARIAERFQRPTILLSREHTAEPYKGSARTVGDFSIFSALQASAEYLIKYGGHDKAAGMTVAAETLPDFIAAVNQYAKTQPFSLPTLRLDCKLNPAAITLDFVGALTPLEPFGVKNPKPLFALCGMQLQSVTAIGNGRHIRLIATKNNTTVAMVMFGMAKENFPFLVGAVLDFAVALEVGQYQGAEQLNVLVKDVRPANRDEEESVAQIEMYQTYLEGEYSPATAKTLLFTREQLVPVYRAVQAGADTFPKLAALLPQQGKAQLQVMVDVMAELGLLSCDGPPMEQRFALVSGKKVDLEQSSILNLIKQVVGE